MIKSTPLLGDNSETKKRAEVALAVPLPQIYVIFFDLARFWLKNAQKHEKNELSSGRQKFVLFWVRRRDLNLAGVRQGHRSRPLAVRGGGRARWEEKRSRGSAPPHRPSSAPFPCRRDLRRPCSRCRWGGRIFSVQKTVLLLHLFQNPDDIRFRVSLVLDYLD